VTVTVPDTGWVACQNVPDTGTVPEIPTVPETVALTVPDTGWVAGKFVTDTDPPVCCMGEPRVVLIVVCSAAVAAPLGSGRLAADTGWVACQNVPVTGVLGIAAILTGWVACQNVPVTAWEAGKFDTATEPVTVAFKFAAVGWATVTVPDTGWVACQNVPDTGTVPEIPTVPVTVAFRFAAVGWATVTVPDTGWVACQNVPVTATDPGRVTGSGVAAEAPTRFVPLRNPMYVAEPGAAAPVELTEGFVAEMLPVIGSGFPTLTPTRFPPELNPR
jgi:hypothetical protein